MFLGTQKTISFKFSKHLTNEVWALTEILMFALNHDLTPEEVIARPEFFNYHICNSLLSQHDYLKEIKEVYPSGVELSLIVRQRPDNIQIYVKPKGQG